MIYHCKPFRDQVLSWKPVNTQKNYLINELCDLFKTYTSAKGNRGVINHRRFIARIRSGNQSFNNEDHHDSHEFLSWLIDEIHMNIIEDYRYYVIKKLTSKDYSKNCQKEWDTKPNLNYNTMGKEEVEKIVNQNIMPRFKTWVQTLFEGELVSITKCQVCERQSMRQETFMNLSIDVDKNVSLSYCLKKFSTKELLNLGDKFFCEGCNTKQVATRQMMIKSRPKLLLIQLKRFKMNYQTMQQSKLTFRIPYP
jgi:ubiquitin C-terminal hydrolase